MLATWRHLNTKNRHVLAPVYTHMANILQPSWLKVATSWNFLEIIGTKGWWIVKSMYYYLVTLNSVVTDLSRRGAISWHSYIFFALQKFKLVYFQKSCRCHTTTTPMCSSHASLACFLFLPVAPLISAQEFSTAALLDCLIWQCWIMFTGQPTSRWELWNHDHIKQQIVMHCSGRPMHVGWTHH